MDVSDFASDLAYEPGADPDGSSELDIGGGGLRGRGLMAPSRSDFIGGLPGPLGGHDRLSSSSPPSTAGGRCTLPAASCGVYTTTAWSIARSDPQFGKPAPTGPRAAEAESSASRASVDVEILPEAMGSLSMDTGDRKQLQHVQQQHHHQQQQQQQQPQIQQQFERERQQDVDENMDDKYYAQNSDGDTALHIGLILGDRPDHVIEKIIDHAPDPSSLDLANDLQQTPLHVAVISNRPKIVRCLLAAGASPTLRDRNGDTPAHVACRLDHTDCFMALADESIESVTGRKMEDIVQLRNYDGDTCSHVALKCGHDRTLQHLMQRCPNALNCWEGKRGATLLHDAVNRNAVETVRQLVSNPRVDVNQLTYDRKTPLDLASSRVLPDIESLLKEAGGAYSDGARLSSSSSSSSSSMEEEME